MILYVHQHDYNCSAAIFSRICNYYNSQKEREIYMRFNKGQYMDRNKSKKSNMQVTAEAYKAGKRQPMAHTLGIVTDLGYDDIASQVKWDEEKQKWYVLNEFERFKEGGGREGEREENKNNAASRLARTRAKMERGSNGNVDKQLTKTTVDMLLGHSEAINQGGAPQPSTSVLTSNGDYGREQPKLQPGWNRAGASQPLHQYERDDAASSVLTSSSVVEPNRGPPSILGDDDTEMARINSKYDIFEKKVIQTKKDLAIKFRKLQKVTKNGKNPMYYHPLSNCDVTIFADAYTKQMLSGPHAKTQLLVSR